VDVWAADIMPMKAPPAAAASAPKPCTGTWDFIATDCQLTWQGITVYGTIDAGVGWQSSPIVGFLPVYGNLAVRKSAWWT
jgi:hypothetical protein